MNFFERQKQRKKQQILNDIKNKQQMDEYRENQSTFGLGASAGKLGYNAIKGNINKQGGSIIANNIDNAINGTANYGAIGNYADDAIKGAATQSSSAVGNAVAKEVAKEATKEATKKIATEGIKKGLGKVAPIVGGAMSAKSAYDRASKGDYVGAGLDAVAGVASFIPGIGTVIAMGAQALNAMKDLKKADEMKAIAKSQEAVAENQSSALSNLNDKKQEIKEQQADNLANAPMIQPNMPSTPMNDTLAQTDTVEPMVMQPTLVEPHNIPAENMAQPVDKSGVVSNILNSVKGMAGKVDNTVDLTQDRIGGMVDNALAKTKSGVNDFMEGYQDNRNTSFTQGDFYNQIKEQEPQITTDEQGNVVLQGGTEETKKSIMAKLGELAGTAGRVASNPYLQGLVAGGVYKATGGDTGESIKYGVDWAQNKAKSDHYANALGQQPGILGGVYGADDYNAQVNKHYKDQMVANMAERIKVMEENHANQLKYREQELAERERHNKVTEGIQAKNADYKNDKQIREEQYEAEMNNDLMGYINSLASGDKETIEEAENILLSRYGTDVLTHIKALEERYGKPKKEKLGFWGKK